jgi:type I restriction enzyme S subunit
MELVAEKYKQTEVGLIPSDWEVKKLGEVSDIKTGPFGSSLHEKDYVNDGTPIITVEHLSELGIVHENMPMVSEFDRKRLSAYAMQTNDIVFSRVGSVDRNSMVGEKENGWLFSGRLLRIRINSKTVLPKFVSYHFQQETFKQRIRSVAVGQTMASLNTQILKGIDVVLPSTKAEQTTVATALSDADALISGLEKLISKKRNIKQGAMQKLLQPKEGWEVKKLGEIGKCHRGVSYNPERDLHPHDKSITVRLLRSNNVQKQNIDLNGLQYVDQERVKQNQLLQDNDIVICMANGSKQLVGKSAIFKVRDKLSYTFGAFMGCFRTNTDLATSSFIALNFQSFQYRNYIDVLLSGSSINNLNPGNIESIGIPFPSSEEQTRIATILSDMDAEINVLETKLEKYKTVKLGMMQNLLTGKIRLV